MSVFFNKNNICNPDYDDIGNCCNSDGCCIVTKYDIVSGGTEYILIPTLQFPKPRNGSPSRVICIMGRYEYSMGCHNHSLNSISNTNDIMENIE